MTGRRHAAVAAGIAAVLAGCAGPATPFGGGVECDGGQAATGGRPTTVDALVQAEPASPDSPDSAAPRVWAGFQRRDGSVVTSLPACFDGVLALFLSDAEGGLGLEAQVEPDDARTVTARDGAGELLVRDSASFHAELLGRGGDDPEVGSFAGWYVHLEAPAASTYAWASPVVWQQGGSEHRGTVEVQVVVG